MRYIVLTAAAFSLVASVAYAQQDTPAQSGPQNPAVKGMHDNNSATPVAGANSFTMGEAKSRIEKSGFSNVSNLSKDHDGVWRGQAQKDGSAAPVWVDYKGNVGQGQLDIEQGLVEQLSRRAVGHRARIAELGVDHQGGLVEPHQVAVQAADVPLGLPGVVEQF